MNKSAETKSKTFVPYTKMLFLTMLITGAAGAIFYILTSRYVINQAEKNIQDLLLSHRGIHLYIQRVMHPALYRFKDEGQIMEDFYSPELLSSSFLVRNQHKFYNEARAEAGLVQMYYKMAAKNPRNPVNKADALEEKLIDMFNQDPNRLTYRDIVEIQGQKYLYLAMPFLKTEKRCLTCHGVREIAPAQLQQRYSGQGGFHERVGKIRAIESIRVPLVKEYYTVYVVSGALLCGVLFIMLLFVFNRRLTVTVAARTRDLEAENRERKRAETKIRLLNEQLESRVKERTAQLTAANKELDAFAYSVSHDLRAPLRGIDGFSLALLEDFQDKLDETGKDYLNRVRNGCVKMGSLIDDILKLSRLSRREIQRDYVNASDTATTILKELEQLHPDRLVDIHIQERILIHADPALVKVVFENLLGNAWKFTSKTQNAKISIETIQKEGQEYITIKDNGAGFDMTYANKLFAAFQRLHSPAEFEGSGIGLATVQRVIHRHGGAITAEGEVGKGATFYFRFS